MRVGAHTFPDACRCVSEAGRPAGRPGSALDSRWNPAGRPDRGGSSDGRGHARGAVWAKAFTLIELLVVIAIIAILAGMPAIHHNGACGFSFADGHAETHKWLDPDTLATKRVPANPRGPRDVPWIQQRTSAAMTSD